VARSNMAANASLPDSGMPDYQRHTPPLWKQSLVGSSTVRVDETAGTRCSRAQAQKVPAQSLKRGAFSDRAGSQGGVGRQDCSDLLGGLVERVRCDPVDVEGCRLGSDRLAAGGVELVRQRGLPATVATAAAAIRVSTSS
jgi:hypothetical protein